MSHNLSRRRITELQHQQARQELAPYAAPGWELSADVTAYRETPTVLGAWQRKQKTTAGCRSHHCARRCDIDLKTAIDAGLAQENIIELVRYLRCNHWKGCGILPPQLAYPRGVPLIAYLTDPTVLVEICCAKCSNKTGLPSRRIIDKLVSYGRGNSATGINDLGARIRGPCRKCGTRCFTARYIWPK